MIQTRGAAPVLLMYTKTDFPLVTGGVTTNQDWRTQLPTGTLQIHPRFKFSWELIQKHSKDNSELFIYSEKNSKTLTIQNN